MLKRIRRKVGDASSLISPFGSTLRRIVASISRKSPTPAAAADNKGNFAASSRNCPRNHAEVSNNEAASRNSAGSSATPIPEIFSNQLSGSSSPPNPNSFPLRSHSRASRINANRPRKNSASRENTSCSTARRPGAHVVRCRSNFRSLSNSKTSSALRLILLLPYSCLAEQRLYAAVLPFPFSFFYIPSRRFSLRLHATSRSRRVKLLHHRDTQRIQRISRFMPSRSHVVAQKRKHQPLPVRQIRITRSRTHMLHRS